MSSFSDRDLLRQVTESRSSSTFIRKNQWKLFMKNKWDFCKSFRKSIENNLLCWIGKFFCSTRLNIIVSCLIFRMFTHVIFGLIEVQKQFLSFVWSCFSSMGNSLLFHVQWSKKFISKKIISVKHYVRKKTQLFNTRKNLINSSMISDWNQIEVIHCVDNAHLFSHQPILNKSFESWKIINMSKTNMMPIYFHFTGSSFFFVYSIISSLFSFLKKHFVCIFFPISFLFFVLLFMLNYLLKIVQVYSIYWSLLCLFFYSQFISCGNYSICSQSLYIIIEWEKLFEIFKNNLLSILFFGELFQICFSNRRINIDVWYFCFCPLYLIEIN